MPTATGTASMTAEGVGLALLLALVPVAIADWWSVLVLTRASRNNGGALRERRNVALILAHAATLYFVIGINTAAGFPWFPVAVTSIFNRSLLLVIGIIPIRFLYLYLRKQF